MLHCLSRARLSNYIRDWNNDWLSLPLAMPTTIPPTARAYFDQRPSRLCSTLRHANVCHSRSISPQPRGGTWEKARATPSRCQFLVRDLASMRSGEPGETGPRSTKSQSSCVSGRQFGSLGDPQGVFAALFAFALREGYGAPHFQVPGHSH